MDTYNLFYDLLRFSIGASDIKPEINSLDEWEKIYTIAEMQSLVGVVFYGIQRGNFHPPTHILMKWIATSEIVRSFNVLSYQTANEVAHYFEENGFKVCVLKGVGCSINYPDPYIRCSGDIDLWLYGGRKEIIEFIKKKWKGRIQHYHHIDIPPLNNIPIEVHYRPSYMRSPIRNRRLQKWFDKQADFQFLNRVLLPGQKDHVSIPTFEFNIVFLLQHMYNHFFTEGFGLRHVVDYYFILHSHIFNTQEKSTLVETFKHLGLLKFAGAMMYVMQEVFVLDEKYIIVSVDERRGNTLLKEIMKGGNFGKFSGITEHTLGVKFLLKFKRNMCFLRDYPEEAICEPFFRTWHFFWRLTHR